MYSGWWAVAPCVALTALVCVSRRCGFVHDLQERFWEKKLADHSPLELPSDHPRPIALTEFATAETTLSADACRNLRLLATRRRVSPEALMAAALALLLLQCSGQQDIVFGVTQMEQLPELEAVAGPRANLLPLRVMLEDCRSLGDLLQHVADGHEEAVRRSGLPFRALIQHLGSETTAARHPLVSVALECHFSYLLGANLTPGGAQHLDFRFVVSGEWGSSVHLHLVCVVCLVPVQTPTPVCAGGGGGGKPPPPPSTRCPRTPQGRGLRPARREVPATGVATGP